MSEIAPVFEPIRHFIFSFRTKGYNFVANRETMVRPPLPARVFSPLQRHPKRQKLVLCANSHSATFVVGFIPLPCASENAPMARPDYLGFGHMFGPTFETNLVSVRRRVETA
jgi:hypothetical protein